MSRSKVPKLTQQELLVAELEEKPWLAIGFSRTAYARDRVRCAWQEISAKLNSDGQGTTKTWQKWSKYWKDKKAAVKRKYASIRMARGRTGGGAAEFLGLTTLEERILGLMGGANSIFGDRDLEINPFHQTATEEEPEPVIINTELNIKNEGSDTTTMSQSILQDYNWQCMMPVSTELNDSFSRAQRAEQSSLRTDLHTPRPPRGQASSNTQDHIEGSDTTMVSESILQGHYGQSMMFERPHVPQSGQRPPQTSRDERLIENAQTSEPLNPASATQQSTESTPRLRRRATVRRVMRGSPPSQRRSQMASLTERFVAIEERRVALEERQVVLEEHQRDGQDSLVEVLRTMSEAWLQQSQSFQDLVTVIKDMANRLTRD